MWGRLLRVVRTDRLRRRLPEDRDQEPDDEADQGADEDAGATAGAARVGGARLRDEPRRLDVLDGRDLLQRRGLVVLERLLLRRRRSDHGVERREREELV